MANLITLTLTHEEALALDALANHSAERLFGDKNAAKYFALEMWSMETAARACDKLHAVVVPDQPESSTWTYHLEHIIVR